MCRISRRCRGAMIFNAMFAVAIEADRRIGVTTLGKHAMRAGGVSLDNLGMANGTVDFCRYSGAGTFLCWAGSGMALGAGRIAMDRAFNFSRIDI